MGDKKIYTIYGEMREFSEAAELHELQRVKSDVLEKLKSMNLGFPIKTKQEFLSALPVDKLTTCEFLGRQLSLAELIEILRDSDFPLRNVVEAADMLSDACPMIIRQSEGI